MFDARGVHRCGCRCIHCVPKGNYGQIPGGVEEGSGDDRVRFNGTEWVAVSTTGVGGAATRVRVALGRRTCRFDGSLVLVRYDLRMRHSSIHVGGMGVGGGGGGFVRTEAAVPRSACEHDQIMSEVKNVGS